MTLTYTINTNNNNSSQNGGWGSVQIISGGTGHLIPVAFSGSAVDTTPNGDSTATPIPIFGFSQLKGGGNANQNQTTLTCTQSSMQTTVGQLMQGAPAGTPPPPGTSLTDTVVTTFTATVVQKP